MVDPLSTSYKRVKIVGLPTVLILNSKREIFFKTEGYNQSGMNDLKIFIFLGKVGSKFNIIFLNVGMPEQHSGDRAEWSPRFRNRQDFIIRGIYR